MAQTTRFRFTGLSAGALALLASGAPAYADQALPLRDRPASDEIIYFLLPDRFENGDRSNDHGGLSGDRLHTGFDPTSKGFFHGGDLKGLTARLDYIHALGATAIWLGPIYQNNPVQGARGDESAGYHGYWITDFTAVDPHFGTAADLQTLVGAAHARGMKLYLDIIVNHTADVIRYRECPDNRCPYRSRADYPDRADGYAYTPYIPEGEAHRKVPEWLNELRYYHNRGNSTFEGESSTLGDFSGLDDVATEDPRVVQGFIDIFNGWIDNFGVDGFRIDTAKHVNPEFWQAFVPAIRTHAAARGIPNFHVFGEVATSEMDPALLAEHTRVDKLPAVLDFAFAAAVRDTVAGSAGTDQLARLFAADSLYEGGVTAALQLPTFISNHDGGRFARQVQLARPKASAAEVLKRVQLAHAMLLTLRGVPTVYSGDEQGFVGWGDDQAARQDMFASQVVSYNNQPLLGTSSTTAVSNFNSAHPLYQTIAALARLRAEQPALLHGLQVVRAASRTPGLFAVSRFDSVTGTEVLLAFNTSTASIDTQVVVDGKSGSFTARHGNCAQAPMAPGSYHIKVAALDYLVCVSGAHP
jgi:glycosidase